MKKLSEYPTTPVRLHLGSNVDPLVERVYQIPAPVAKAADAVIEYMPDALNNACDHCEHCASLLFDELTGQTICQAHPKCPIALGWKAYSDYKEACRELES